MSLFLWRVRRFFTALASLSGHAFEIGSVAVAEVTKYRHGKKLLYVVWFSILRSSHSVGVTFEELSRTSLGIALLRVIQFSVFTQSRHPFSDNDVRKEEPDFWTGVVASCVGPVSLSGAMLVN